MVKIKKIRLYHGTLKVNVSSIKKRGLLPSNTTDIRGGGIGQDDVDLVNNFRFAHSYGEVVIEVLIPRVLVKCSKEMDNPGLLFCTAKRVSKKFIKKIHT